MLLAGQVAIRLVPSSPRDHLSILLPKLASGWLAGPTGWTLQGRRATRRPCMSGRWVQEVRSFGTWRGGAGDWTLQGRKLDFARTETGMCKDWLLHGSSANSGCWHRCPLASARSHYKTTNILPIALAHSRAIFTHSSRDTRPLQPALFAA